MAYLVTGGSLIQSSYRINGARVFDAVVYWAPDHQHLDRGCITSCSTSGESPRIPI